MKNLDSRELEILDILGFKKEGEVTIEDFLREVIKKSPSRDLHNQGVPRDSVKKILAKFKPGDPQCLLNTSQENRKKKRSVARRAYLAGDVVEHESFF